MTTWMPKELKNNANLAGCGAIAGAAQSAVPALTGSRFWHSTESN